MITLYDFDSGLPSKAASPYVWRVRFALNVKGIKHKTEWLEFGKLDVQLKERGVAPTGVLPDGSPHYTVPAVFDSSTNTTISDSHDIIKYLDEAYPDTPQLCSHIQASEDDRVKAAFSKGWDLPLTSLMLSGMWGLLIPTVVSGLNEDSAPVCKQRFWENTGTTFESVLEEGRQRELKEVARASYSEANAQLEAIRKACGGLGGVQWLSGKEAKLPDLAVSGSLAWVAAIMGEESELWKEVIEWDGGRWAILWDSVRPFHQVY